MSNADQVQLVIAEQTNYNTIGTTTGTELRFTSEDLKQDTDTVQSAEIRDDRQVGDVIRTSIQASGSINGELSFSTYDTLMKLNLFSAGFSTGATASGTTISFAAASGNTQEISDSGSGFGSFSVGPWVLIAGSSEAANNGVFKVSAAAAGAITVYNPAGVVDAAGDSVTVTEFDQLVNGTTHGYFAAERVYGDLSTPDKHVLYTGLQPDTMALTFPSSGIPNVTFGCMGKQAESLSSAQFATVTAANTKDVMNTTDDVFDVWLYAGASFTNAGVCVIEATLNTANNLRGRPCIGVLGPNSWGAGKFAASGTLRMYFETKDLMDEYLNFTTSQLAITLKRGGDYYVFELPSIKFTSGQRVAGGENTDIVADMAFTAYEDASEGITMRIAQIAE